MALSEVRGQGPVVSKPHPCGNQQVHRKDGVAVFEPYRPTTRTVKLPGTIVGRGRGFSAVGAGRGPNSAAAR